ncbi:MAG: carbohydrate porin [Pseudomonadota bacterium]|nr:carbohydrate porin [Pseudomonadota bacterium]
MLKNTTKWFISMALILPLLLLCLQVVPTHAASDELLSELQNLKAKLEQLEQKVARQDRLLANQQQQVSRQNEKIETQEKINAGLEEIKDALGGIEIGADITMIGQGTFSEDDEYGYDNGTDASFSFDLEVAKSFSWGGSTAIVLEGGNAEGMDGRIATWSGFNDDNDDDETAHVTEAWYEQSLLEDKLTFTFGKIDLTNYFDASEVANDETTQFLSTGFVNNLAVEFPDNGPGARVTASPSELVDISFGWMAVDQDDGESSWDDIGRGSFAIGEIDFKPVLAGLNGNYRLYGWYMDADHKEWDGSDDDQTGSGFGLSLDQQLIPELLTVFARAAWQDEDIYEIETHYSAGLQLAGKFWDRDDDVVGLAYGFAKISSEYEDYNTDNSDDDEHHLELYYRLVFNDHFALTADYQWINNPAGNSDADNASVFGLRTQIDF